MDRRDKARAALVRARNKLDRARAKREDAIKAIIRCDTKTIPALEQEIRRIGKRIDKIDTEAFVPPKVSQPESVPLAKLGETEIGKANKASWVFPKGSKPIPPKEAAELSKLNQDLSTAMLGTPKPKAKRERNTPDKFRAEVAKKKAANKGGEVTS
jgi:hypothetical protein